LPRKFLAFFKKVLRELEHKKEIRSWGKEQMQFLRERECEKGAKGAGFVKNLLIIRKKREEK